MALKNPSLVLYGFTVNSNNQYLDFTSPTGTFAAVIAAGSYNLTDFMTQVAAAMTLADPANTYTVIANRTIAGGTQNRVTISTSAASLSLLFASGVHNAASPAALLGYTATDKTGSTSYIAQSSAGSVIIPIMLGYNWVAPTRNRKVLGKVNVSAAGIKEAVTFQLQQFFSVDFRLETESRIDALWQPFFDWAIQQQEFEFTPDITNPDLFYPCTLESTPEAADGLQWEAKEMLPEFPGLYQLGKMRFRIILTANQFISG